MFGRQDNHGTDSTASNDTTTPVSAEPTTAANSPFGGSSSTSPDNSAAPVMGAPVVEPSEPSNTASSDLTALPSSSPVVGDTSSDSNLKDNDISAASKFSPPEDSTAKNGSDDLLSLKQQALQQLTPLVGHLDQTPEEKFRTTMMMIQAADNQTLIKDAYEAAQQIGDEKQKAQALLDIVNEINYFTTKQETDHS